MNHNEKKALIVNYLKESNSNKFTYWNHLYSFSTENLTDYFTKELFTNKKVLLTGSSADQILTAQLYKAKSITNFDLNPFVKYLYDLKLAGIKELELNEFLDFFSFNYDTFDYNTSNSFSLNKYILIRKSLTGDSLDFWDHLFKNFDSFILRTKLFFIDDEERDKNKYKEYLPYLSQENYNKLKKSNDLIQVEFIETDILKLGEVLTKKYDLIYFSNIFNRLEIIDFYNSKKYIKNLYKFLTQILKHTEDNGIILLNYLYNHSLNELFDSQNKYTHHIRFPIKIFKCQDNMLYLETKTVCPYHECKTDIIIGYQKKKKLTKEVSYGQNNSNKKRDKRL